MDSFFAIVANITQILSFLWLIFLGSKTLFDLKKQKKFLFKPLFLTNIFQAFIILFLSSAFLFSHPINPRPTNPSIAATTPTSTISGLNYYAILQEPALPLSIPCELSCTSNLGIMVNNFYVTQERTTPTLNLEIELTNKGTSVCNMVVKELKITDNYSHIWDARGSVTATEAVSPKQTIAAFAFFETDTASGVYTLHTALGCSETETMIYQSEQFTVASVFPH